MTNPSSSNPRKGIYFLPSLFTTVGLFFGFYSIIQASQGNFSQAASAVFIAIIMDGLDGRVARWTNTASDFGKEYDSLVDVISSGVAPGMIIYFWSLQYLGKVGWLVGFLYAAATALRLARFNTLTIKDNRYFYGLACPAAAAFVVFWVWNFHVTGISGESLAWVSALVTILMSLLMVSNIKYRSFYAASGPVGLVLRWRKGEEESPAFLPDEDDDVEDDGDTHSETVSEKNV